ncbi:hypothetical protein TNCV_1589841 [Trichonephila clavipes]|uniref:Uncharacterized protein n=1 Tax=Trichonephila clavipes TaxID=2585209 RepID=A0A8X6UZP1_TRICX|nr:hypothetical protein TNCV_1589841 [Trichonephila clavipes]
MSHDYVACKSSLECLFDLGVLGKIETLRTAYLQNSGASLWGENWASKLLAVIGIYICGAALKGDTSSRECTRSAAPLEIKNNNRAVDSNTF